MTWPKISEHKIHKSMKYNNIILLQCQTNVSLMQRGGCWTMWASPD